VSANVSGVVAYLPKISHVTMPTNHTHLRIRDAQSQSELTGLLDTLQRELDSDKPAAMQAASMYAGLLSVWIARQVETGDADAPRQTAAMKLVKQYTDLIEHGLHSGQTAGNYAETLGVTSTHLTRVCKSTCGRNASTLLAERLISEAQSLLSDTKRPINEIAANLGYRSPAYFSRAFQSHTGVTPSRFRQSA
jgi:AraC-like DNA-binding protein